MRAPTEFVHPEAIARARLMPTHPLFNPALACELTMRERVALCGPTDASAFAHRMRLSPELVEVAIAAMKSRAGESATPKGATGETDGN